MITDMVKNIVGDQVPVVGLIGEGVDPHLFRPTIADVGRLMPSDLVVYNGLMLEGQMQPVFEQFQRSGKTAHALGNSVPKDALRVPDGLESHPDPHIWGDAKLWAGCVDDLTKALVQLSPQHAAEFEANAARYKRMLLETDERVRTIIGTIPEQQRYLVTAHDAFGYFSQAYGIQVRSVQGITTESDPGVADINELVDFLVGNKIPAIFIEATVNQANIKAVIEGARQKGWEVKIGGTLFSDSMGAKGTPEGTYVGMLEYNARTIAQALGGSADPQ
jgi:manganese/zinc/iron transport system substrate-binding protein